MTDHTQLRKRATEALLDHEIRCSFTISHGGWCGASDLIDAQKFIAAANPQAVIELLDEIERLKQIFRVNMLRAFPEKSHDEITAEIEKALK